MTERFSQQLSDLLSRAKRYQMALLVLSVGLVLMLFPGGEEQRNSVPPPEAEAEYEVFDLSDFEKRLSRALSQVEGAGETTVVLTLRSGSRRVLAQDLEQDGQSMQSSVVTVEVGSAQQETVTLQTISPQFQGALAVCPGGENPDVRLRLVGAISALTGLGSDHISICKGTQ